MYLRWSKTLDQGREYYVFEMVKDSRSQYNHKYSRGARGRSFMISLCFVKTSPPFDPDELCWRP